MMVEFLSDKILFFWRHTIWQKWYRQPFLGQYWFCNGAPLGRHWTNVGHNMQISRQGVKAVPQDGLRLWKCSKNWQSYVICCDFLVDVLLMHPLWNIKWVTLECSSQIGSPRLPPTSNLKWWLCVRLRRPLSTKQQVTRLKTRQLHHSQYNDQNVRRYRSASDQTRGLVLMLSASKPDES